MKKTLAVVFVLLAIYIGYQMIDNFDPESLRRKNVIITGASSGIGEQLAYQYCRYGANILITARREQKLKEVVQKCQIEGRKDGQYHYIALDMAEKHSRQKLIQYAEETLGRLDVLVLNHALFTAGMWHETADNITRFDRTVKINFHAYMTTASHALPALEKSDGSIIVMSSPAGKIPAPNGIGVVTAQHALEGFFSSLREEFIMTKKNISITICSLGLIGTESGLNALKEANAEHILDYMTPTSPADAASAIVKAGAQKWQRLYYPYMETRLPVILDMFFPETMGAMSRKMLSG